MILTLQKLIQKSKQVSDPRDAHALALDLVESMLRHYAVVAIAAYRHAGAKDAKINRILSEQLPRPSMGSWKNFLQVLSHADPHLFPESFWDKFLQPLMKRISHPDISAACGGVKKLIEEIAEFDKSSRLSFEPVDCTPLEYLDYIVSYRNRFAGHGTQMLPSINIEFTPILLKGVTALCHHLRNLWLSYPVYVAKSSHRYGLSFFRLVPLVEAEGIGEVQVSDLGLGEDRLYLCFGERRHPENANLYPLALWEEEDILFYNGTKDFRDFSYIGYVSQRSIETNVPEKDFREFFKAFTAQEKIPSAATDEKTETKPLPSIAVLPFVNMSADPEQEYFCDGITEEIINALSHVEALKVIARTSAFAFKGKQEDIREIGKKLDVENLLEGSIRKAGNRLRITAQLVKVVDGSHLWSEKFDREMEDVFIIQDEISLAIVRELKVRLLKTEETAVVKRHTVDTEAYELYLRGWYLIYRQHEGWMEKGIEYFKMAVEKDPNYALPYAGIAYCYNFCGMLSYMNPRVAYSHTKAAAEKALELDDMLAEAHTALGYYKLMYAWDFSGAEKELKRAIEINPNYATGHHWYSMYFMCMGKFDEAIAEIHRARQLDPLSVLQNAIVGCWYSLARRYNEALEYYEIALEMDQHFPRTYWYKGLHYTGLRMWKEATASFQKLMTLAPGIPFSVGNLGFAYAKSGQKEKALELLKFLDKLSENRYVSPYYKGLIFLGLEEKDVAFEYFEKAIIAREPMLIILKVNPIFDSVRGNTKFQTLLKKIGLPE